MWYVIYARDVENSLKARKSTRPAHVQRLKDLLAQGRLLVAGPMPAIDSTDPGPAGFCGSMIVAEFGSLEEAEQWAQADPYIAAGVYDSVKVHPYLKVLP